MQIRVVRNSKIGAVEQQMRIGGREGETHREDIGYLAEATTPEHYIIT